MEYVDPEDFRDFLGRIAKRLNKFPLSNLFFKIFLRTVFSALKDGGESVNEEVYANWRFMEDEKLKKYAKAFIQQVNDKNNERNWEEWVKERGYDFDFFWDQRLKLTDIGCDVYFRGEKLEEDCFKPMYMIPFFISNDTFFKSFNINEQGSFDKNGEFFLHKSE